VDTLVGLPDSDPLRAECRLVVTDEAHHLLRENKWGRALDMFPNARGLGLSATPIRADGKGLGRHADGVFDILLEGPSAREIELMGFLAPHVIYAPPSDLDLSAVPVSASGDYSPKPLVEATRKSHIMGDVVDHYRRLADGLLGMTFCVDVESAAAVAAAFRASGVPAEVVTGKTPPDARNAIFRRFRQREILQLVSCEIAGEGFDLPDVEVISLARASESYALATQQIGRVKRALPGKTKGIVIDHVGNTTRHCQAKRCEQTGEWYIAVGEREWSLDRRERRSSSKVRELTLTTCVGCLKPYPRVLGRKCPYCSHETQPAGRSAPEQVDGVLAELDAATLAAMQREIAHVDGAPTIPWGATPAIQGAVVKRHRERQEAQAALRAAMAQWAGLRDSGTDAETVARLQREFFLQWGVDVASAQALGRSEADELRMRIDTAVNLPHNAPH
jgi:superfamily II DNA or RNA helicase